MSSTAPVISTDGTLRRGGLHLGRGIASDELDAVRHACGGEAPRRLDQVQGRGVVGPVAVGAGVDDEAGLGRRAVGGVGVGVDRVGQDRHPRQPELVPVDGRVGGGDRPDGVHLPQPALERADVPPEKEGSGPRGPGLLRQDAAPKARFHIVGVDDEVPGAALERPCQMGEPGVAHDDEVGLEVAYRLPQARDPPGRERLGVEHALVCEKGPEMAGQHAQRGPAPRGQRVDVLLQGVEPLVEGWSRIDRVDAHGAAPLHGLPQRVDAQAVARARRLGGAGREVDDSHPAQPRICAWRKERRRGWTAGPISSP